MHEARDAGLTGLRGKHGRPRLGGPEEGADQQLRGHEHQQDRGHQSSARQTGAGSADDACSSVQGERRTEDREQCCRQQQRPTRGDRHDAEPDEGRADRERGLVGCAFVGEGHVDEPALLCTGTGRDRAPAHPRQRSDLGHRESGERRGADEGGVRGAGVREDHEEHQAGGPGERLDEHDVALADPVGERARERRPDRVRDRESTGGEAAETVAAGGVGHEEEGAELAHRERQSSEEGDDDVRRPGKLEEPTVGGEG